MRSNDRRPVIIVGAGGFGREVVDIVRASTSHRLLGFVDDGPVDVDLLDRLGVPLLGRSSDVPRLGGGFVIGIGRGDIRQRLAQMLSEHHAAAETMVHPAATIGACCDLGDGVIVCAGARITTNIRLGKHVDVHVNATIGHDSILLDYVSVYPGATVSGNVAIGARSTIGTGANVLPGVTIGADTFVGAGAVVVRDVPDGLTVAGVPARPLQATARGGSR